MQELKLHILFVPEVVIYLKVSLWRLVVVVWIVRSRIGLGEKAGSFVFVLRMCLSGDSDGVLERAGRQSLQFNTICPWWRIQVSGRLSRVWSVQGTRYIYFIFLCCMLGSWPTNMIWNFQTSRVLTCAGRKVHSDLSCTVSDTTGCTLKGSEKSERSCLDCIIVETHLNSWYF